MGLRGPIGRGQGGRPPVSLTIIDASADSEPPPTPPIKLRAPVQAKWDALWRSQVARYIDPDADAGALERWCHHQNEWHRLQAIVRKTMYVPGSQGQPVLNPLFDVIDRIERHLEKFEDDFAARPKARVRLNLEGVQGALTAEQLNRMVRGDRGDDDAPGPKAVGPDHDEDDWTEGFAAAD